MSCQCYNGSVPNINPLLPDSRMCKVQDDNPSCGLPMMMPGSFCTKIKDKKSCESAKYVWDIVWNGGITCSRSCRWIDDPKPPPPPPPKPPKPDCSKKPYSAGCPCFHSWDCDESKGQMICAPKKGSKSAVCQPKPATFLHPF